MRPCNDEPHEPPRATVNMTPAGTRSRGDREYEAPSLTMLGTIADLTRGGSDSPDDGFGGAGLSGTL
jgi:hypothetical protein